jgi:hypothetical protein
MELNSLLGIFIFIIGAMTGSFLMFALCVFLWKNPLFFREPLCGLPYTDPNGMIIFL